MKKTRGLYILPFKLNKQIKRRSASVHRKFNSPYAIDWAMPVGMPILAAHGGIVVSCESRFNSCGKSEEWIHKGNHIQILSKDNEYSVYGHLKWRGLKVKKGQKVRQGQIIGYSGKTGFATYPHLHFAVYDWLALKRNNEWINLKIRFLKGEENEQNL